MAYSGLSIETTVHDPTLSSHTIPAYPEYYTSTTFNAAFYAERRDSCDELVGAAVDYIEGDASAPTPPDTVVDISDAAISGTGSLTVGGNEQYTLGGANSAEYTNDYQILWTVPPGEGTVWGYESDVSDILTVTVGPYTAGSGTVTCTLVERGNPGNSTTVTKAITVTT